MTNRLANETSPYLLQHAHNPVDWYPWGEEAFAKSRAEDKPVFLSIGYSACHWCHVMERESFENEQTAALLNERFVSIKVDREERPDIDSIYMQAVQLMNGRGGWPMSVFLTPEGKPFYAGTYFPPEERHGMPGFPLVIVHVSEVYRQRREEVERVSTECTDAIRASVAVPASGSPVTREALDRAAAKITESYDPLHGGFGGAPKFPPSMTADFLMQAAHRSGDSQLRDMLINTLTKMARGGMYDQIGGGFHRYSVDARWLVPHFEKMLYDNALLARLYTRAWQWTKEPLFARIAREILGFVQREMTAPDGGFYATLDADSEGEEGKFYVWSRAEVLEALGVEEGRVFCALYDITEAGNFEGHNIPNVPREPESVAADFDLTLPALETIAARGKRALYALRSKRVWPGRDQKILSGWNGWMLAAFADAAIAFDDDGHRDTARGNADFLLGRIGSDGHLLRHARIAGLLEDYSGVAWGLTLAYEATHARTYLDGAVALTQSMITRFSDPAGGFFDTASDAEKLISRPKDLFDNATPGAGSVAADVLLRLALLTGNASHSATAIKTLESAWPLAEKYPSGFGFLLGVAEWRAGQPREIALTGDPATSEFRSLRKIVGELYLPHRVLAAGSESASLPLLEHREMGKAMAYVCTGYACQEPVSDPERLRALLSSQP